MLSQLLNNISQILFLQQTLELYWNPLYQTLLTEANDDCGAIGSAETKS